MPLPDPTDFQGVVNYCKQLEQRIAVLEAMISGMNRGGHFPGPAPPGLPFAYFNGAVPNVNPMDLNPNRMTFGGPARPLYGGPVMPQAGVPIMTQFGMYGGSARFGNSTPEDRGEGFGVAKPF